MLISKLWILCAIFVPTLIDCKKSKDDIRTYLYIRHMKPIVIRSSTERSSDMKHFIQYYNPKRHTKIIIHGWRSNVNKTAIKKLITAYRDTTDHNIIGIDWKEMTYSLYPTTLKYLNVVGEYVAELIHFLVHDRHTRLDRIHIVGHSLGAHVAGIAGSRTRNGKVARITGLDPAAPGIKTVYCLNKADAKFVDVIHTAAGLIGMRKSIGHADFYPNNGKSLQPGCVLPNCSHRRSVIFFTESIYNPKHTFLSYKCVSWRNFKKGMCNSKNPIQMGEHTDLKARGKYYLRTRAQSPYSMTR